MENLKEWTSLLTLEQLTRASCKQNNNNKNNKLEAQMRLAVQLVTRP